MIITVLAENTTQSGLPTEHGLSLYIRTEGHSILFDTGQSGLFADNAKKLGIDLESIDMAVISHGHYDHGGGLQIFFEKNSKAPVYISRYAFEPHYNAEGKYIGLDTGLLKYNRFIFIDDTAVIEPGLTLCSCNDRSIEMPLDNNGLSSEIDGKLQKENFRHEQYFLIEENGKRILISGCSHKGIINIVRWFSPDILIGGFHFWKLPINEELRKYSEILDSYPIEYYTCHCTGTDQYKYMQIFMSRLHYISAGQTIEI